LPSLQAHHFSNKLQSFSKYPYISIKNTHMHLYEIFIYSFSLLAMFCMLGYLSSILLFLSQLNTSYIVKDSAEIVQKILAQLFISAHLHIFVYKTLYVLLFSQFLLQFAFDLTYTKMSFSSQFVLKGRNL
jgi:hypothetical protein